MSNKTACRSPMLFYGPQKDATASGGVASVPADSVRRRRPALLRLGEKNPARHDSLAGWAVLLIGASVAGGRLRAGGARGTGEGCAHKKTAGGGFIYRQFSKMGSLYHIRWAFFNQSCTFFCNRYHKTRLAPKAAAHRNTGTCLYCFFQTPFLVSVSSAPSACL